MKVYMLQIFTQVTNRMKALRGDVLSLSMLHSSCQTMLRSFRVCIIQVARNLSQQKARQVRAAEFEIIGQDPAGDTQRT